MDTQWAAQNNSIDQQQQRRHAARVEPPYQNRYITLHHTDVSVSAIQFLVSLVFLCVSFSTLSLLPSSTEHSGFPCEIAAAAAIQSFCRYTNCKHTAMDHGMWALVLCTAAPHVHTQYEFSVFMATNSETKGESGKKIEAKTSWNVHRNDIQQRQASQPGKHCCKFRVLLQSEIRD